MAVFNVTICSTGVEHFSSLCLSFDFICRVSIKESSVAKLGSVCRRVYRIFSHAYFHHRPIFDEYEVSCCKLQY